MDMILSQEELNQIQSIDSLEELKNFIFSSIGNNESNESSNSILRTLSRNEYIKYLTNNALDGAITKNDDNVWHHKYKGKWGSAYYENRWYKTIQAGLQINTFKGQNVIPYHSLSDLIADGNMSIFDTRTDTFTLYNELYNNNVNNKAIYNTENKNFVFEFWGGQGGDAGWRDYKKIELSYQPEKTFTKFDQTVAVEKQYDGNTRSFYGRVIIYSCFRPVIQYIDNKNSIDIFK